jgi:integrase
MSDKHINFTKKALEALSLPPTGKRVDYHDSKTPGLALRVTASGTKSFALYRRINGRPERVTLGKLPTMTVEQAREAVATLNGQVAAGINPAEQKRGIRQEITLGELFDQYLERHAKAHKKSWETDELRFNAHLAAWRNKKLSSIKRTDVSRLHAKVAANTIIKTVTGKHGKPVKTRTGGPGAANQVLRLLHTLFKMAILWGWDGANPASGVKEFAHKSRDRFLQPDEMPKLFKALMDEPNETARDYFLTALFTGARRSNVLEMRWDQINLDRQTWRIPRTKNGDPQTIPLVPAMVELLERRKVQADSPWVFPGNTSTGHISPPNDAWRRIIARAGITDPRGTWIHDLRRSLGSWQAATGANLSIISKSLNHRNISTTAIYARLNIDSVRESMEKATAAMLAAGGLADNNNVVTLRKAKG